MAETVIAVFLLTIIALLVFALFHSGLRYAGDSHRLALATQVAEDTLAEIRAWAREPGNFSSNWAPYRGVILNGPDGMQVRVDCDPNGIDTFSPCLALEQGHAPNGRKLERSVVAVEIEVLAGTRAPVILNTVIAAPVREVSQVRVSRLGGAGDPVSRNDTVTFGAELLDGSGNPIPDVMFEWYVQPVTGNGEVLPFGARSQVQTQLVNRYGYNPFTLDYGVAPGTVKMRARAVYHGQEFLGESTEVTLSDV